jgi:AAA domain
MGRQAFLKNKRVERRGRMKFVLIFGPQAVGKMTVGQELEKITKLKLFHNHMTLELLYPFFGFGPETWRLSDRFRQEIFEAALESDLYGIIFTYVWAFDQQRDWDYVDHICSIFESKGGIVYFVELEADLEVRLERKKTSHRLEQKPSKKNITQSELDLKQTAEKHRLNSLKGEIRKKNYIRINNPNLEAEKVAKMIKDKFRL